MDSPIRQGRRQPREEPIRAHLRAPRRREGRARPRALRRRRHHALQGERRAHRGHHARGRLVDHEGPTNRSPRQKARASHIPPTLRPRLSTSTLRLGGQVYKRDTSSYESFFRLLSH